MLLIITVAMSMQESKMIKQSLVILNGSNNDQLLNMDRYRDVISSYTKGIDVITGQELDVTSQVNVPARGVFVMDLK